MVSIIVVTYNAEGYIRECIDSLISQTFKDIEILVVDNNSKDNSLNVLKEYESITVIKADKNLGFAGACNLGYKHAKGDIIALLNPDAVADKFWLEKQISWFYENNEIGITASKIIVKGTNIIDSAADCYSNSFKAFKRGEGKDASFFNKDEFVWGACGGACAYRKEMIEEIGLFDEDFFLIHEDSDLNFRAKLAGWKCLFVHNAIVYHDVRSSIGKMSDIAIYYTIRNNIYVRIKNVPLILIMINIFPFLLGKITEFNTFAIKNKKIGLYFKAQIDIFKNYKKVMCKRKKILKIKKINNSQIKEELVNVFLKPI